MTKKYNKLVRDNVPKIINESDNNTTCTYRQVTDPTEFVLLLCNKLIEETEELRKSILTKYYKPYPDVDYDIACEVRDVKDVVKALEDLLDISVNTIYKADFDKSVKGGFGDGIVLQSVETSDEKVK